MRAPLIVVLLVVIGGLGYYLYSRAQLPFQRMEGATAAAQPLQVQGRSLALFNDVCIEGRASYAETEQLANAAGWVTAADDVHPNLARIMAFSRGAVEEVPATNVVLQAYANPQRSEYIVLTGMVMQGRRVNGCYIYDFAATQLPDVSSLVAAIGAPSETRTQAGVVDSRKWTSPAALPGVAALSVAHFPEGSPAESELGFHGLLLKTTSMSAS